MVRGGWAAYVPFGVQRIIPSVFSFYATAPTNDISRPAARSLALVTASIILYSELGGPRPRASAIHEQIIPTGTYTCIFQIHSDERVFPIESAGIAR